MDKILYNDETEEYIQRWWKMAEYKHIDNSPFEEIEIVSDMDWSLIYKGDRVIFKSTKDTRKYVGKTRIKDGKVEVYKTTFTDFKNELPKELLEQTFTLLFSFIVNYHREENRFFIALEQMENIIMGKGAFAPKSTKDNSENKEDKRTVSSTTQGSVTKLVTMANAFSKKEGEKREYTRKTESWKSRGYYRRKSKKNPEMIWVAPSIKGNKNGKVEDKVYKI